VKDHRDSPNERFNNHNWVEVYDGSGWSFTGAVLLRVLHPSGGFLKPAVAMLSACCSLLRQQATADMCQQMLPLLYVELKGSKVS
jgi:hypothetical protein